MSNHPVSLLEQGKWRVDGSRSTVGFLIRHLGVATVRGRFSSFQGQIDVTEAGFHADATVDVASLETGDRVRDGRLRTEFFDAEHYPAVALRAGLAVPARSGGWLLRSDVTIRGITRPVELRATAEPLDDGTVRVRADGQIRRTDFGLDWDALRVAGRLVVADRVRLTADAVLVRQRHAEPDGDERGAEHGDRHGAALRRSQVQCDQHADQDDHHELDLEQVVAPALVAVGERRAGGEQDGERCQAGGPEAPGDRAHRRPVGVVAQGRDDRDHQHQLAADEERQRHDVEEADDRHARGSLTAPVPPPLRAAAPA